MSRILCAFLTFAAFVPATTSRAPSYQTPLKNPVEIRVTSPSGDSIPFHVEVRGGALLRVGADGRWHDAPGGASRTPAQFRAFPDGQGLLFTSDRGGPLHVEAWRMVGSTRHTSGEGEVLLVRAAGPAEPPEVVPAAAIAPR
jgi:hypothetical protein